MKVTQEYKYHIENLIVDAMLTAWEKNIIAEQEQFPISKFVLEQIDKVSTHEDLISFLAELSAKWSFFKPLYVSEQESVKKHEDNQMIEQAQDLAKSGNIDQALAVTREIKKGE